jgi:hypothetical protein
MRQFSSKQFALLSVPLFLLTTPFAAAETQQLSMPVLVESLQHCEENVLNSAQPTSSGQWVTLLQANCKEEREAVISAFSDHMSPDEQKKTRDDLMNAMEQHVQVKWDAAQIQQSNETRQKAAIEKSQLQNTHNVLPPTEKTTDKVMDEAIGQ